jgi:hypothetical protein
LFFQPEQYFLSQQISQQCFSAGLSAQPNGSNVAAEAVTAQQGASRSIQGVSSDIKKHHAALAVAAGAPAQMGTTQLVAKQWMDGDRD